MDPYIISLRVLHIVFATFWVGASVMFAVFIEPAARQLGPEASPFMGNLVEKRRLPEVIAVTSVIAIVAGALLYWRVSSGLDMDWIRTRSGTTFTVGALAAITAWLIGFTVLRPGIAKSGALRAAAATSPGAAEALERVVTRLARASFGNVALLIVAVIAMAMARYM